MLVLALDTATPAVTAGLVELTGRSAAVRAQRRTVNPKAHGELLTPQIRELAEETGVALADLSAIVCGAGPGPFTGLRVGMITAGGLGHALGIPVYPVCSLDALAVDALGLDSPAPTTDGAAPNAVTSNADGPDVEVAAPGGVLTVTDARRREVYWATYQVDGRRAAGPAVAKPDVLSARIADLGVSRVAGQGAELYGEVFGLPVVEPAYPSARGLVIAALDTVLAAADPDPLSPMYLRRPDAVEPSPDSRARHTVQYRAADSGPGR